MSSILKEQFKNILEFFNYTGKKIMATKEIFVSRVLSELNGEFLSSIIHLLSLMYPFFTYVDPVWIRIHNTAQTNTKSYIKKKN